MFFLYSLKAGGTANGEEILLKARFSLSRMHMHACTNTAKANMLLVFSIVSWGGRGIKTNTSSFPIQKVITFTQIEDYFSNLTTDLPNLVCYSVWPWVFVFDMQNSSGVGGSGGSAMWSILRSLNLKADEGRK